MGSLDHRRPAGRVIGSSFAVLFAFATASMAQGVPAHDDQGLIEDAEPRYEGPGHAGARLVPNGEGQILDVFDASGVALLSWVPLPDFPGNNGRAADIWGYVSPSGREYAIVGLERGVAFVEVTEPTQPEIVGFVDGNPSIWREMSSHGPYAYIVHDMSSEYPGTGDGVITADLTRIDEGVVTVASTLTSYDLKTTHNVQVNPASATAYLCGSNIEGPNLSDGGLIAVDLSNPAHPTFGPEHVWREHYVHDVVVTTYTEGPYAGREIAFAACGGAGLVIIDVTDKSNMWTVSQLVYPNTSYCHDGWLSEDRRTFYINDELDELDELVGSSTTYALDVEEIEAPAFLRTFTNGNPAIDHNFVARDRWLYEANYRSGLRVYDVATPGQETEVAYFDTYPANDNPNFNGAWGVFADLPSRSILISDINRGLFVLEHTAALAVPPGGTATALALSSAPNPFRGETTLRFSLERRGPVVLDLLDAGGRRIATLLDRTMDAGSHGIRLDAGELPRDAASGVYFASLRTARGSSVRQVVLVGR